MTKDLEQHLHWYRIEVADEEDVSPYTRPVVDGDTAWAWIDKGFHDYTLEKIRLLGIDTPERGEDGFEAATDNLRGYLEEAERLLLDSHEEGKYGRPVGTIWSLYDGEWFNINERQIQDAHAEVYE